MMLRFLVSLLVVVVAFAAPEGKEGKAAPKPSAKKAQVQQDMAAKQEMEVKQEIVNANDQINLQPMRDCSQCWECYACTHDEHYGTVGNCVPILGCIPSECSSDDQCGAGRVCAHGACHNQQCSASSDCDGGRVCYYGECRDSCHHSSDCTDISSGDICEHGLCVCSGSMC